MAEGRSLRFERLKIFGIAFCFWVVVLALALKLGAVSDLSAEVLSQVRLPRVLLASIVGMGLAVAGTTLQALFTNPLCEPYTLGVSSGAALGAVIGNAMGMDWSFAGLTGSAFLGAMICALILLAVAHRSRGGSASLLLSGVMLGFLGTSLVAVWASLADPNGIQSAMGWLFGDLSRARIHGTYLAGCSVFGLIGIIWTHWRQLDGLLLGEEGASALGIDLNHTRKRLIFFTSLLVGVCVSAAGMIGFVGLVVPHLCRKWVGSMHARLIPLSAIWGAIALTLADCVARTVMRPFELPVGVVTSLIGAPIFLVILFGLFGRSRRE